MNRHFNSYLHKILECIKKEDREFTFNEVETRANIKIVNMISALKNNKKVKIEGNTIRYIPEFNIKNKEDILEIVKNEGIEMDRLCDSFVDVRKMMNVTEERPMQVGVKKRSKIALPPIETDDFIILRDLDGQEVVFRNEYVEGIPDKDETYKRIVELYNEIEVPNYQNVCEYLKECGQKTKTEPVKKKGIIKSTKKKKSRRRIKITNTHVEGLDLNDMQDDLD